MAVAKITEECVLMLVMPACSGGKNAGREWIVRMVDGQLASGTRSMGLGLGGAEALE
jgi:hypothetical protein